MADINKEASWVTARLLEVGNATNDGVNVLITNANIQYYNAGSLANTLGINKGGTGATDAAGARTNLDVPSTGDVTSAINTAVAPKADKVTGATPGNFAGLDANGDLTDSGLKASDFMPALASGVTPGDIAIIGSNRNIIDSGKSFADIYDSAMIHKTASGAIVTIEDGANDVPLKSMTVQIQPIQAGSGDPSPSNVRAISGWTAMKIPRTPANLLCKDAITEGYYIDNTNGALVTYTSWYASDWIKVTAGKQYRARVAGSGTYDNVTNGNCYFAFYDSNRTYLSGGTTAQMNAPTNAVWLRMSTPKTMFATIIVVELSYANEYVVTADYTEGNTYEIEFPTEAGTVYGGELTVNEDGTGTLVSDWAYKRLSGTVTQYPGTGYELMYYMTGWQSGSVHINGNGASFNEAYRLSNMLKSVSNVATAKTDRGAFSFSEGSTTALNRLYGVYPDGVNSASEMSTWLTNNEVYIAYKLQTAQTYQLTAPQVSTLLGLNNIWADTGDISLEYHADPTIYVSEKTKAIKQSIAYLQDDFTAIQPYVVNDLVYVGDTMYIVTSAIAQGATMTPNTNCAETTLNAVIKSLR